MEKAVEKEEMEATKGGCRLPKSPFSQDMKWDLLRMGRLRVGMGGLDHTADASRCQVLNR